MYGFSHRSIYDLTFDQSPMTAGNWSDWTDAVWNCIELMGVKVGSTFTLDEIYEAESILARIYPKNKHIKDKIRQQLQIMREQGYLKFVDNSGVYRRIQ